MAKEKHTFGKALLLARKQKGLSQQQLADSIPVIGQTHEIKFEG